MNLFSRVAVLAVRALALLKPRLNLLLARLANRLRATAAPRSPVLVPIPVRVDRHPRHSVRSLPYRDR